MACTLTNTAGWAFRNRLAKELRMLLLPSCAAIAVAYLFFVVVWLSSPIKQLISADWQLSVVAGFVFFGCLLLIAVVPFGREFQHRTLWLLLSLPLHRKRLFLEKLVAPAVVFLLLILLIGGAGLALRHNPNVRDALGLFPAGLAFAVSAMCSAPLWTLSCKSTIGGAAFTWTGQFVVLLVMNYMAQQAHVNEGVAMGIGLALYSGGCLWLSWRTFARFQAMDGFPASTADLLSDFRRAGAQASRSAEYQPGNAEAGSKDRSFGLLRYVAEGRIAWLDRLLRCGHRGSLLNLFRKELRLQMPVFLLAALFMLCWIVIVGICLSLPQRGYEHLFPAILALYVPLVLLLAGSISMSEEVGLGVSSWHLAVPVPVWRQWGVKLVASLIAGAAAGWVLPLLLSFVSEFAGVGPRLLMHDNVGVVLLCVSGLMFLLSFWAVMLAGNTVRAVFMAILALVLVAGCFAFGSRAASQASGLPAGLGMGAAAFPASIAVLVLLVLAQSLQAFRRPGCVSSLRVIYPGVLLIVALAVGFLQKCDS